MFGVTELHTPSQLAEVTYDDLDAWAKAGMLSVVFAPMMAGESLITGVDFWTGFDLIKIATSS